MKKRATGLFASFLVCILLTLSDKSFAQDASRIYIDPQGWAFGIDFGMSDMWGNVGTKTIIDHYTNSNAFNLPCFIGGFLGRYTIHPCLALKFQLNVGALYATDEWNFDLAKKATSQGDDGYQRYARKQDAKDYIGEVACMFEYSPFRTNPESRSAHRKGQFYIGAGLGGFYFQPYATLGTSKQWVQTYDLDLEGQGWGNGYPKKYSLFQPCVPVDIGYKWDISNQVSLGVEVMYRFTFFGYLDGVSNFYVDSSAVISHLSPALASEALAIIDKSPLYKFAPNPPGTLRGIPSLKDGYSTIGFTLYFRDKRRVNEWWRH